MAEESEVASECAASQVAPRLSDEGYGLEIQGYDHHLTEPSKALVFLPKDTPYRIRLSNANDHICMVTIEMDSYTIGTFLLHPFTKCDVERPTDRPLGFMFLQDPTPPPAQNGGAHGAHSRHQPPPPPPARPSSKSKKHKQLETSSINAVFKPETGGRVIQMDVSAEHLNKTQRLEMKKDSAVADLFEEIQMDFGDWILGSTCVLVHWSTAEYDSPVEDILTPSMQTVLGNLRRQDDPIRKMSLLSVDNVELHVEGHEVVSYAVDSAPTFQRALHVAREALLEDDGEEDGDSVIYFLSTSGRYLCSSEWVKDTTPLFQVMHRDEILGKHGTLVLRCTVDVPPHMLSVIARLLNDGTRDLQVAPETTLRECRIQLECLGGPWGEDPRWLFGGTLMENRRNVAFYAIGNRSTVDVVPRMKDVGTFRSLEMKDPVAVDGERPVNTAEMIRREESRNRAMADSKKKKKPHRGGTTLRGRSKQQYIEVDPVETDDRFQTRLAVNIMLKENEDAILANLSKPQKVKGKTCTVS